MIGKIIMVLQQKHYKAKKQKSKKAKKQKAKKLLKFIYIVFIDTNTIWKIQIQPIKILIIYIQK